MLSEIEIIPVKPTGGIIGFASLVLDEKIYLSSIAIHTRPDGSLRITYPTKKAGQHNLNVFHPINRELSAEIEKAILRKAKEVMNSYVGHTSNHTA